MSRVCFFGAWDPAYPRNRILREGLRRAGLEVLEARVAEKRAWRRYPALASAFARVDRATDVLLVPEFRHKDVPLASWLAHGRLLVFDPLVSRHDTLVGDWRLHREGSAQSWWNRRLDAWSFGAAGLVLCDTWAHGELFASIGVPRAKLARVFVGAEDAFFEVGEPPAEGPVRVVYVGGFLPLHGVKVMLEAFARLEARAAELPAYEIELVGAGIEYDEARAEIASRGVKRVTFTGRRPYAEAPAALARAHVVMGVFGTGAKTARVIPHKVWQGAAAGRAVVSGDTPALREAFEPGVHVEAVPVGDAAALAGALALLIGAPGRREALGLAARVRARETGSPERVGASLVEALRARGAA